MALRVAALRTLAENIEARRDAAAISRINLTSDAVASFLEVFDEADDVAAEAVGDDEVRVTADGVTLTGVRDGETWSWSYGATRVASMLELGRALAAAEQLDEDTVLAEYAGAPRRVPGSLGGRVPLVSAEATDTGEAGRNGQTDHHQDG